MTKKIFFVGRLVIVLMVVIEIELFSRLLMKMVMQIILLPGPLPRRISNILNPAASRNIIFNELYLDFDKEITIVEGIFDAMKAENAVPILGSTLSENSVLFKKIIKYDTPIPFGFR